MVSLCVMGWGLVLPENSSVAAVAAAVTSRGNGSRTVQFSVGAQRRMHIARA